MSDVLERLRAINPVPLEAPISREPKSEMHQVPRWRRLALVAAAAVLVLGVVSSVVVLRDESEPAGTKPASESTIERLVHGRWHDLPDLPSAMSPTSLVWTGRELLAWGNESGAELVDGRWRTLPDWGFGNRAGATVRWTGKEMIVWGGADPRVDISPVYGAAYNPRTRTWRALPNSPVPQSALSAATWTGRELIVTSVVSADPPGASYDPSTDQWSVLPPTSPSPGANLSTRAVRDGRRVVFTMSSGTEATTYDPRTKEWVGNPPFSGTAYGSGDLFRSGPWVVQLAWREPSGLEASLRRRGGAEVSTQPHPSICGIGANAVPGGAVFFCDSSEFLAFAVAGRRWVELPLPPSGAAGSMVWTAKGLVVVAPGGNVHRLSPR